MLLSPKQHEFVLNANRRWNFKGGATRSGKTYLDFRWMIPIRIRDRVGKDGLTVILGVTKSTIERNVLEPMRWLAQFPVITQHGYLERNAIAWELRRFPKYQKFVAHPLNTAMGMRWPTGAKRYLNF